ncbi:unnamed protein product [Polarella glacialis]|uniref:Uncharacterized protein n=1 Tax=Polarella glacialis TaxID=89957 RepID=A0A813I6Z8_POLGL|nr:unnamed protein product [Polarella glacialis]
MAQVCNVRASLRAHLESDWHLGNNGTVTGHRYARTFSFVCISVRLSIAKVPRLCSRFHSKVLVLNAKPNKASGKYFVGAIRNGHWYVVAPKIVSLKRWSHFEPWKAYAIEGWWLDNMLKASKLTRDTYLELAAKVNIGFQKYLMDVRASERFEKELAVHATIAAEEAKLQAQLLPMSDFAEVDLFVSYFDGEARFRRPMFAIVGGTNLGKSLLAAAIMRRIGDMTGVSDFLEVTVEDSDALDLVDVDRRLHAGVILDGAGDALLLKRNRETLQGRPKTSKGAKSATNVYASSYNFLQRAVVDTFDLSAANLDALLSDR